MTYVSKIIADSGIQFGTSGARGLVSDFTPEVCAAFTLAFLQSVSTRDGSASSLAIAIDNRPSSSAMAAACASAAQALGISVDYYGVIPTPALAYQAMQDGVPAIMVTGSHIPFDRNGLKFYRPEGEITKQDEQAIIASDAVFPSLTFNALPEISCRAAKSYLARYLDIFPAACLTGLRIGLYEHSSAGRDLYSDLLSALGAEVISLERTDTFIPIDTEAVSQEDCEKARGWSELHQLDAIFSTDGDGDRPLIADEQGNWLRGDIVGLLCSQILGIEALAVPVSCNTAIEKSNAFAAVARTKIGSPYVIAEFKNLSGAYASVAGFEANGGFLLGADVQVAGQTLKALPTRDAVLPALVLLHASASQKVGLSQLVDRLPQRYTASDRIKGIATEQSRQLIAEYAVAPNTLLKQSGLDADGTVTVLDINQTDGLRMTLSNSDIIHLRPSGNAPELRCYAEADNQHKADRLVKQCLQFVSTLESPLISQDAPST
jgi:phosphomannomutase